MANPSSKPPPPRKPAGAKTPPPSKEDLSDWIQDAVIARAEKLGLSSYAIAQATGGKVSEDHVRAYITRSKSMGSHKLQHVLQALGLRLSIDHSK